jgi:2-oxo-3-hexenedioate decarboxylase
MALSLGTIEQLAAHLDAAQQERREVTKITDAHPLLDQADAYAIQYAIRRRRLARGHRIAGLKMGLTSRAKMKQMGVEAPLFGFMTEDFALTSGAEVPVSRYIHPRVEPEIAFVTRAPLRGPGCHVGTALAATDFVVPAMELLDSRYKDFKFDLNSVIADNTSAAGFVIGDRARRAAELDLPALGVVLEKNGEVVALGAGAAVLGNPAASVAMLANMLAARGEEIPAGTLILTGGITEAITVAPGDHVCLRAQDLGSVSLRFVR